MFTKIKQLLEFLRLALRSGPAGLLGVLLIPLFLYLLYAAIFAEGGLVQFIQRTRDADRMEQAVAYKRAALGDLNLRIELIKNRSPDYMEELIQKNLNMAAPGTRILK
ncbi:MAG: septum formation initiator family protein [Rickettsiales bacterium]|jgi:cell division protein FtsB|nr:septum formation initiator family protein [Rickettsiales bacterium]